MKFCLIGSEFLVQKLCVQSGRETNITSENITSRRCFAPDLKEMTISTVGKI